MSRMKIVARWIKTAGPVLLDVAAFCSIIIGVAVLFGAWAWLAAGGLLIAAGIRASEPPTR